MAVLSNCVTHHDACECREALHKAEIEKLKEEEQLAVAVMSSGISFVNFMTCRYKLTIVQMIKIVADYAALISEDDAKNHDHLNTFLTACHKTFPEVAGAYNAVYGGKPPSNASDSPDSARKPEEVVGHTNDEVKALKKELAQTKLRLKAADRVIDAAAELMKEVLGLKEVLPGEIDDLDDKIAEYREIWQEVKYPTPQSRSQARRLKIQRKAKETR